MPSLIVHLSAQALAGSAPAGVETTAVVNANIEMYFLFIGFSTSHGR
jgi:hypothetical protein